MVTVNWLLNEEPMDAEEQLAVGVMDSLMLGRSSSPLRKRLTESGLGESVTGGGLSDDQCIHHSLRKFALTNLASCSA